MGVSADAPLVSANKLAAPNTGIALPFRLRRLAAQAAVSECQEERLRQLRAQGQDNDEEAAFLAAQHGAIAKTVAHLLTQLRATPRAQLRSRAAGARVEQAPEARPWEIRADA